MGASPCRRPNHVHGIDVPSGHSPCRRSGHGVDRYRRNQAGPTGVMMSAAASSSWRRSIRRTNRPRHRPAPTQIGGDAPILDVPGLKLLCPPSRCSGRGGLASSSGTRCSSPTSPGEGEWPTAPRGSGPAVLALLGRAGPLLSLSARTNGKSVGMRQCGRRPVVM